MEETNHKAKEKDNIHEMTVCEYCNLLEEFWSKAPACPARELEFIASQEEIKKCQRVFEFEKTKPKKPYER